MYVLQPNVTSVAVLALEAPGQAKNIGQFNLAQGAKRSGLSIGQSSSIQRYRSDANFMEQIPTTSRA